MKKYRILLVDDSPNILKALQRTFRLTKGYGIFSAGSANTALEIMETEKIDMIITDENMPGISGTELLKTIRVLHPHVIRFMLTGQTDIEVAKNAINDGAIYRFFTKPWDDFELLISVRYAFKQRELERENTRLKSTLKQKDELLNKLEEEHPGITEKRVDSDGAIIIDCET